MFLSLSRRWNIYILHNYNYFFDRVIRILETNYADSKFDIFVFNKIIYDIYALFIYITHNLLKMFTYLFVIFVVFRRLKNINL